MFSTSFEVGLCAQAEATKDASSESFASFIVHGSYLAPLRAANMLAEIFRLPGNSENGNTKIEIFKSRFYTDRAGVQSR
jgi:hypothetical protein